VGIETWLIGTWNIYKVPQQFSTILVDEILPTVFLGDKSGLYVHLAQSTSKNREIAARYMPRSYYIQTPCGTHSSFNPWDTFNFDQWDFWVHDYYQGNPPVELLRNVSLKNSVISPADSSPGMVLWNNKQPEIDQNQNLWIIKATTQDPPTLRLKQTPLNKHEGVWIHVVNSPSDLLEQTELDNQRAGHCVAPVRLVQKYVETPYLYQGAKADFRVFVFVLSLSPPVAYFNDYMPAKAATELFTFNTTGLAHITNLSKAKSVTQVDTIMHWSEYMAYLSQDTGIDEAELQNILWERIKVMIREVLSLFPKINPPAFSLGGWDVIFDENLHPWLMEINRLPDWNPTKTGISGTKKIVVKDAFDFLASVDGSNLPAKFKSWNRVYDDVTTLK